MLHIRLCIISGKYKTFQLSVRLCLVFGLTPNTLRNFQKSVGSLRFSILKRLRLIFSVETDLHNACSVTVDNVRHHVELIQQTAQHALASQSSF